MTAVEALQVLSPRKRSVPSRELRRKLLKGAHALGDRGFDTRKTRASRRR